MRAPSYHRVSRILAQYGLLGDTRWFTAASRERGKLVHWVSEQVFLRQPVDVSPDFGGYQLALEQARDHLRIEVLCVERRLSSAAHGVTGRPDVVGWLPERRGDVPAGPVVVDIKSGDPYPSHAVQLAFYELLADAAELRVALPRAFAELPWSRLGLYVRGNGTYRLQVYDDPVDRFVADALRTVNGWRELHGLTRGGPAAQPDDETSMEAV